MADRQITDLTPVTSVSPNDSFVLQQNNKAMRLTGQVLINYLLNALDGHGGINSIIGPTTSGLNDTYTIHYADTTTSTFVVKNGKGISSITKKSTSGLVDTYQIKYNDNSTSTFTVTNGRGVTSVTKSSSGLTDTYTITYSDSTTYPFSVTNGKEISSVTLTSTSGLVHTYTIRYNDNSTDTFNVTDGAQGPQGDNAYIWIRYSAVQPTKNSDMKTLPDNWMGVYTGISSTAPTSYSSYTWFQIKGDKGDKGDDITIDTSNTSVMYNITDAISSTPPQYDWTTTFPTLQQGKYLWTRTITTYSDGVSTTAYTISYQGVDGAGTVKTVQGFTPDSQGNVRIPTDIEVEIQETGNTTLTINNAEITARHEIRQELYIMDGDITWSTQNGTLTLMCDDGFPNMKLTLYLPTI